MAKLIAVLSIAIVASVGSCRKTEPASSEGTSVQTITAADGETDAAAGLASETIVLVEPPALDIARQRTILGRENIVDQEPMLHIASKSPRLKVDGWLKGEPVSLRAGKVYVVENWATWCKPCIEQIPHLSKLAGKYRDRGLVVIAVNVEDENLDRVRSFVANHAKKMRYRVAYEQKGYMMATWVKKAGLAGLPASFVVDREGRIAWMGHPEKLGPVVEAVMEKTWSNDSARAFATRERLAVPYSRRVVALLSTEPDRGYKLIEALLSTILADQPEYLNGLAYHIFAAPQVAKRDLNLAYLAGALACQTEGWSNPQAIETLSKIREQQGFLEAAIALQRRAVRSGGASQRFTSRLDALKAKQ